MELLNIFFTISNLNCFSFPWRSQFFSSWSKKCRHFVFNNFDFLFITQGQHASFNKVFLFIMLIYTSKWSNHFTIIDTDISVPLSSGSCHGKEPWLKSSKFNYVFSLFSGNCSRCKLLIFSMSTDAFFSQQLLFL